MVTLFSFLQISLLLGVSLFDIILCDYEICKNVKRSDINKPRNDFSSNIRLPNGFDRGHIIGKKIYQIFAYFYIALSTRFIIASSLGGTNSIENLTVQKKSTNRGCYRSVEIKIKNFLGSNICDSVQYCVKLIGNKSRAQRNRRPKDWPIKPKSYKQEYYCIKNGKRNFYDKTECSN